MESVKYFFSYSRQDAGFVTKLATDLKNRGLNAWLDKLDILPGERWDISIETALNKSSCLLVILSNSSIKSDNVLDEAYYAIDKGKRVIPLLLHNCELPYRLTRIQRIDFTEDYNLGLHQLLKAINEKTEVQLNESSYWQKKQTPYQGKAKKEKKFIYIFLALLAVISFLVIYIVVSKNHQGETASKEKILSTSMPEQNQKKVSESNPVQEFSFKGNVGKLTAIFNLTFNYDTQKIEDTYYYPLRNNMIYQIKGTISSTGIELTEFTSGEITANCTLTSTDNNCYVGKMFNTNGKQFDMKLCKAGE